MRAPMHLQNDQLTLKTAHGSDLWFHIQKQPGSHVVLLTNGTPLDELPDRTIEEAAMLAACNRQRTGTAAASPLTTHW